MEQSGLYIILGVFFYLSKPKYCHKNDEGELVGRSGANRLTVNPCIPPETVVVQQTPYDSNQSGCSGLQTDTSKRPTNVLLTYTLSSPIISVSLVISARMVTNTGMCVDVVRLTQTHPDSPDSKPSCCAVELRG